MNLNDLNANNGKDKFIKHFSRVNVKSKLLVNDFSLYSNSHITHINIISIINLSLDELYNYFMK